MSWEHIELQVQMEFEFYMHEQLADVDALLAARSAFCEARTAEDPRRMGKWKWGDGAKRIEAKRAAQKQCSCKKLGKRGRAVCGFCVQKKLNATCNQRATGLAGLAA